MRIKKVTKDNLEFITKQLQPETPIILNKKTNTYIFYEEGIKAVVQQKKKRRTQKLEIIKYDPNFSITQILPGVKRTKYLELPKEENLEEKMQLMNYEKVKEENDYQTYKLKRETVLGMLNLFKALKQFNVKEQFKDYFKLWRDEPEFKLYEMLNIASSASSGALMGAIMPSFWDYGSVLKLAGPLIAVQRIATPLTSMASSGSIGTIVDKAATKTEIKDFKKLQKKVGALQSFITIDTYLMQQNIIQMSPSPEITLLGLYTLHTIGMTAGKMGMESKSFFAIRDYLIRKNPEIVNKEHKEKFYQIIGTGQALEHLCYVAMFTPSWLICKANPLFIFPIATVSGIMLIISKFLWAYQRKLKNPVKIKAKDYIEKNNSYVFDTGWTLKTKEPLEKKLSGYQLPLGKKLTIKSDENITVEEKKYSLEFLTEKSKIKIKTKEGYELKKVNKKEYMIKVV